VGGYLRENSKEILRKIGDDGQHRGIFYRARLADKADLQKKIFPVRLGVGFSHIPA